MPKVVTESEREQVREAIYQNILKLIRDKGIKKITVDEITAAVGISKGAFYAYYPSKEAGIYETLKRSETELFGRMEALMSEKLRGRERIERFFREVYLAPDSVILNLPPTDLEVLLRKLPPEYRERESKKSRNYFERSREVLQIDEGKMETLALLTDCLGVIVTNTMFTEKGKQVAVDVMIGAIAGYMEEEEQS